MATPSISDLNKVTRGAKRAVHDKEQVYKILDDHMICHVGYVYDGYPITIPTGYGRHGDTIYLHGSMKNRMLRGLLGSEKVSITVTHLDGLVLARSVFHHSVNYRSAIVFGKARLVDDHEEKMHALEIITENFIKGRWKEARAPNEKEFEATLVLAVSIDRYSAKVRNVGVNDEKADYQLDVWAGVVPIQSSYGIPEPDEKLQADIAIAIPESVRSLSKRAPN